MALEFLSPVSKKLASSLDTMGTGTIGRSILLHDSQGMPALQDVEIAIIGIQDNRDHEYAEVDPVDFTLVRKSFYKLFLGNWDTVLADLGDIVAGNTLADTLYLVQQITTYLLKKSILPVFLGGSQQCIYASYRAFDKYAVNVTNIDSKFDLGDFDSPQKKTTFLGKMLLEEPCYLFNYSTIGYQVYCNSQQDIDLMDKLFFDAYRLGEVVANLEIVEPVLRNTDLVSIDCGSIQAASFSNVNPNPNGFSSREICAISRYAGISDKVKIFGIYEFKNSPYLLWQNAMLVAQMLWYFVEGVNFRSNELEIKGLDGILQYAVPVKDQVLSFYKSEKTKRWWVEIPFVASGNNKLKRHTLLPCTYSDYQCACNQEIPNCWYRAKRKNEV